MKTICSLFLFICFSASLLAQSTHSKRNSLSIIQLEYPDSYSQAINQVFDHLRLDSRYDINDIPTKRIQVQGKRLYTNEDGKTVAPDRTEQIVEFLNSNNVGLQIIAYLFQRDNHTGLMSLDRLHQRGLYNASDENIFESQATKRGIDQIKEEGFELISNSFIMIYDYPNLRYEYRQGSGTNEGDYYWVATPSAYLCQIDWNEALQNQLFDCWIDADTPPQEHIRRIQAFNNLRIPVRFIRRSVDNDRKLSTGIEEQNRKVAKGSTRKYNNDELKERSFNTFLLESADYLGEEIVGKTAGFQITNALYATHPLRVKIGRKESVKVNDRYYVYENILQPDGSIRQARRGVIRATSHIANNLQVATGQTPTTEFYQIAGRPLDEGMTIKEKRSLYMNLDLGYRYGKLEGGYAGLSTSFYATRATNHNAMLGFTAWKEALSVTLDYGFGFRCTNFDIYPYVGAGLDSFWNDKEYPDYKSSNGWFAQGGVRFNLNLYYPLQLFGAIEYNYLFSENDAYKEMKVLKDRDINGVNVYGGLRFCF